MTNKLKFFCVTLPFVFLVITSNAQSALSDLEYAVWASQMGANASNPDDAAYFSSHAFDGSGHNHSSQNHSGSTVIPSNSERRRAPTDMSKVGLHINSSGNNRGAKLAEYYAQQRAERAAERARLEAERYDRMLNAYMENYHNSADPREMSAQIFIYNNSQAKPLSPEQAEEIKTNGVEKNLIFDDNGKQYLLPENLLEGSGETHETLGEKLKYMSEEEIDQFAKELDEKQKNNEELTDEEWDFLIALQDEREARIAQREEEQKRIEEEINRELLKQVKTINIKTEL